MIKPLKREKIKTVNFKITLDDWNKVQQLAKRFTEGNVSEWIRKSIVMVPDKQK